MDNQRYQTSNSNPYDNQYGNNYNNTPPQQQGYWQQGFQQQNQPQAAYQYQNPQDNYTPYPQYQNPTNANTSYQGQENSYQGQMNGYQEQMNGYQGQMNGYQGQMNAYQGQMNGYQEQMNGYQGQMNGYQGQMNGYQGQMNGYQGQMNGYQETPSIQYQQQPLPNQYENSQPNSNTNYGQPFIPQNQYQFSPNQLQMNSYQQTEDIQQHIQNSNDISNTIPTESNTPFEQNNMSNTYDSIDYNAEPTPNSNEQTLSYMQEFTMSNEVITPNATMPDSNVSEVVNNLPDSDLSEAVNDIQDSFLSESVNDMQDNDLSMSVNSTQDSDSTNDAGTVENLPDTDPLDDSSTPMRDMFLSENDTFLKQFHDDFGEDLIKEVSAALSEQTSIYQDNTTWDTSNYPNRDLNNTQTYPEKDAMTYTRDVPPPPSSFPTNPYAQNPIKQPVHRDSNFKPYPLPSTSGPATLNIQARNEVNKEYEKKQSKKEVKASLNTVSQVKASTPSLPLNTDSQPLSLGFWLLTLLLITIPVVNVVCLIAWACGVGNKTRTNYARAFLIYAFIISIIVILIFLLFYK